MGWFGDMSGLGHDKPAFTLPPNIQADSPEAEMYEAYWNVMTPSMYHDQNPHDWVVRLRNAGHPIPEAYKDIELWTEAELTAFLQEEGYSDGEIQHFFRTGSLRRQFSDDPRVNWMAIIFYFVILPTILWNATFVGSPRWMTKKILG
jgi:hypothetical protein